MILKYKGKAPQIESTAFVAENATLIGEVYIGAFSSIWFSAVLRGDLDLIAIGHHTSVQDGVMVHVAEKLPTKVGNYVTIGHGAILHGCDVKDHALIGSGANILDKAVIGEFAIVAAGTVVTPGTIIPARSMVMGIPGKVVREVTDEEIAELQKHADGYVKLMKNYQY